MTPDPDLARRRRERLAQLETALAAADPSFDLRPSIGRGIGQSEASPGLQISRHGAPIAIHAAAVEVEPSEPWMRPVIGSFRPSSADGTPGFVIQTLDLARVPAPDPHRTQPTRYVDGAEHAVAFIVAAFADAHDVRIPAPTPDARGRRRALERTAAARSADAARAVIGLEPAAATAAPAVAGRLVPSRIAWFWPRRPTGRIDPKAVVLIAPLGPPDRRPGTREPWVGIRAGEADGGSLLLKVDVEDVISENEDHRWVRARWRWDAAAAGSEARERWGADAASLVPLLNALDGYRWDEVIARSGVTVADELRRLLDGRDATYALRDLTTAWAPRLAAGLAGVAWWRLAEATSLLRKGRPLRLFGLGGVTQQRKPGVFLGMRDGRPSLELEFSASNERLPEPDWARPPDLDLVNGGLLDAARLPG